MVSGTEQDWPPLSLLLTQGGDERIAVDAATGVNRYGCRPFPDPQLVAFASSTASVISEPAWHNVRAEYARLQHCADARALADAQQALHAQVRARLLRWLGVAPHAGRLELAASGTDAHARIVRWLLTWRHRPLYIIMPAHAETGSGVAGAMLAAAAGQSCQVHAVRLRDADGGARARTEVDAEVMQHAAEAVLRGQQVLVIRADVSKSGLVAPGLATLLSLREQYPGRVDVLIDACQMRMDPAVLRDYLQCGFGIVLTGSKFYGGPSFSGAWLWPVDHAVDADPQVMDEDSLPLLLRWQAALFEMERFSALPQTAVRACVSRFGDAVMRRLHDDAVFRPLDGDVPDRLHAADGDAPTLFAFLLCDPANGQPLAAATVRSIYRCIQQTLPATAGLPDGIARVPVLLGQPVVCGGDADEPLLALRLSLSAPLIASALADERATVIANMMQALEKTSRLVRQSGFIVPKCCV